MLIGSVIDQVAAILSAAVFSSGAVFAWQCARGQLVAAALQPALLYSALLALLLPLPLGFLYQVRPDGRSAQACSIHFTAAPKGSAGMFWESTAALHDVCFSMLR